MTTTYRVYWMSQDGQNSLDMGTFDTFDMAKQFKSNAWDILLGQASEDAYDKIAAGSMEIDEINAPDEDD